MAELKTKRSNDSVAGFIKDIADTKRREDSSKVLSLMQEITGEEPKMWGSSIVGFGTYHYKYASGQEGDWFKTGFSPRKQNLTLYIISGFEKFDSLMEKLGKYKTGKSCLYINKLEDIDLNILRQLISESVKMLNEAYGSAD